ncbi:MAG: hypothetical protein ABIW82_11640 [Dokdonella sp.]
MRALKIVRVIAVFIAGACAGGYAVLFTTLWLGTLALAQAQLHSRYDVGNGGVVYFFLGIALGIFAAPFAGVLGVIVVERMIESWSKFRAPQAKL